MGSQDPPQFLLLLPPGPAPPTAANLKAAFGDTLSQVLKEVASHSSSSKKAAKDNKPQVLYFRFAPEKGCL